MNDTINNPMFQSAIAPLVLALIVGACTYPLSKIWAGLALMVGYSTSIYLTIGLDIAPLTSTRKIILVAGAALIIGLIIDRIYLKPMITNTVIGISLTSATLWVAWPFLVHSDSGASWIAAICAVIYCLGLTTLIVKLKDHSISAAGSLISMATGLGLAAVIGASALLGQLIGAIGATAGAVLMLLLVFKHIKVGMSFILPAGVLISMLSVSAVMYANLDWRVLIPISLIPLVSMAAFNIQWKRLYQAVLVTGITAPFSAIAVFVAWQTAPTATLLY